MGVVDVGRQDLSKYTVPTSFVGITVPTKVVGMLVTSALPTKLVGMNYVIFSIHLKKCKTLAFNFLMLQLNQYSNLIAYNSYRDQ